MKSDLKLNFSDGMICVNNKNDLCPFERWDFKFISLRQVGVAALYIKLAKKLIEKNCGSFCQGGAAAQWDLRKPLKPVLPFHASSIFASKLNASCLF